MKIKYKISPVCPNFNNIVCALLVAFLLHSCNKNDYIKQECIKMQKEKVCVPVDQLKCLKSSVLGGGEERYRYILYLDSVACMPCAIRGLSAWTPIINELNGKGNLLSLYVIVETKEPELFDLIKHYTPNERTNVYVDTAKVFKSLNPHIPDEIMFHQFLLNDEDSVIIVGDPVSNEKIFDLVNERIHG